MSPAEHRLGESNPAAHSKRCGQLKDYHPHAGPRQTQHHPAGQVTTAPNNNQACHSAQLFEPAQHSFWGQRELIEPYTGGLMNRRNDCRSKYQEGHFPHSPRQKDRSDRDIQE